MTDARIEAAARAMFDRSKAEVLAAKGFTLSCTYDEVAEKDKDYWRDLVRPILAAADAVAWRPIESAPRDGAHILTYYADGRVMTDTFPYRGFLEWQEQLDEPPIYWQPLPAPPHTSLEGGGNG